MQQIEIAAVLLGLVLMTGPVGAAQEGQQLQVSQAQTAASDVVDIVFSKIQKKIIEDYYGKAAGKGHKGKAKGKGKHKGKSKQLPPGLAKRSQLPPGLAKKSKLPPGLAKRRIPPGLAAKLGVPPHGTEHAIVDDNVLLIESATGVVLDILKGVIK
jgi:hypothetical protein